MKRWMVIFGFLFVLGCAGSTEAGILDEWESWDKALSNAEVKNSALYDFVGGSWLNGTSAEIISIKKDNLGLVGLRAGYVFSEELPYGELELQVPNIAKAYIPQTVKDLKLSLGSLDLLPSVGGWVGYRTKNETGEDHKVAAGISVGFKLTF